MPGISLVLDWSWIRGLFQLTGLKNIIKKEKKIYHELTLTLPIQNHATDFLLNVMNLISINISYRQYKNLSSQ